MLDSVFFSHTSYKTLPYTQHRPPTVLGEAITRLLHTGIDSPLLLHDHCYCSFTKCVHGAILKLAP